MRKLDFRTTVLISGGQKETLTIEYFRIVLKKDLGENFWGEKFFG